jgi:hypothetical protein
MNFFKFFFWIILILLIFFYLIFIIIFCKFYFIIPCHFHLFFSPLISLWFQKNLHACSTTPLWCLDIFYAFLSIELRDEKAFSHIAQKAATNWFNEVSVMNSRRSSDVATVFGVESRNVFVIIN